MRPIRYIGIRSIIPPYMLEEIVISEMYDWDLRLAIPLYLTTAFVGASRIQANEHFLSDVIAGITLGTVVGMSVAKYHKEKDAQGVLQNISITPVYDGNLRGGVITLKFL